MKEHIGSRFRKILLAALVSMVAYIALYFIWGAILGEVKQEVLRSVLLATLTSAAYALILMLLTKHRRGVGSGEVLADYQDRSYTSLREDLKLIWPREKATVILLGSIIGACLLLNKFDAIVFGKKVISAITFPFGTMCIYSTCFPSFFDFIGYFVSFAVIAALYITFVLLYRRKQYKYWHETDHTNEIQ